MKQLLSLLALLVVFVGGAQAQALSTSTIDKLPNATLDGTDYVIIQESGTTGKSTLASLEAWVLAQMTSADLPTFDASKIATGTLPISRGGTGAATASAARASLGLEIGVDVMAFNAAIPTVVGDPVTGNCVEFDASNNLVDAGAACGSGGGGSGDITGVTAGEGLIGGGLSGDITLDLSLDEFTTTTAQADAAYFSIVTSGGNNRKIAPANIGLSILNNDAGFVTGTGARTALQENGSAEMLIESMGTACADGEIPKANATGGVNCSVDATGGGGSPVILDILDDGTNESSDLVEIAILNDTFNAFTEPIADKLQVDVAPFLMESELDSEAELEAQISGVTNIYTNNDGTLADDNLGNNNASDLQDVAYPNALADGQILVRDQSTDGRFENVAMSGDVTMTPLGVVTLGTAVVGATELDEAGVEAGLEAVLDHDDLQGFVANEHLDWTADQGATNIASANVPLAATATALAANGGNCSAGLYAAGVDASGVAEGCADLVTQTEGDAAYQPLDADLTDLADALYAGLFRANLYGSTHQALSGTTPTWNVTSGSWASISLTGNTAITLSNMAANSSLWLRVTNGASHTLSIDGTSIEVFSSTENSGITHVSVSNTNGTLEYFSTADPIGPLDLDAIDTAADEECPTYEASSGQWEWQACSGSGSLTVEEADGAPTVASVSILQFDQADGFSIVNETGGQVQVDFALPANAVGTNELASTAIQSGDIEAGDLPADGYAATYVNDDGDTYTGFHDFGGATRQIPNGATPPASCAVGDEWMDTDATSGQRHLLCESANTWVVQGDGGGGGSPGGSDTHVQYNSSGSFAGEAGFTYDAAGNLLRANVYGTTHQSLSGTTVTWDVALGSFASISLSGNTAITLSNMPANASIWLRVTNGASHTLSIDGTSVEVYSSAQNSGLTFVNITNTNTNLDVFSTADPVDPDDLLAADTPSDEECYTYEATGTTGEWQTCGGGGGSSAGASGDVQYGDGAGGFLANGGFNYNATDSLLTLAGDGSSAFSVKRASGATVFEVITGGNNTVTINNPDAVSTLGININGVPGSATVDINPQYTAFRTRDVRIESSAKVYYRPVSTLTIADGGADGGAKAAGTLTPHNFNKIDCQDADGCTITISESGAVEGHKSQVVIISSTTGSVDFSDTADVSELAGAFTANQYDTIGLMYIGDRWIEINRSDN